MNDKTTPLGLFNDPYNDSRNVDVKTFYNPNYQFTDTEVEKVRQEMLIHKLQTLRLLKLIEDSQYKSLLGMLASPDERDKDMARDAIRTLVDDAL